MPCPRARTVLTGGAAVPGRGWFYQPTVLTDVAADSRCLREEIFGPMAPISTFTDDADAVARANGTEYGLVGYIYTDDQTRVIRVAEALEFGMIGVNTGIVSNPAAPFGGVKQSGVRTRGRGRGDRRVPRDQVRRHRALTPGGSGVV